ncbi:enoyl-CoA hydratase/isomerase family protein [Aspergillus alliaceus]|uniref:enoyl-CoA hydratase/isomerase family protein n=1 Tax=Petromyces alliaceus TaxID=209559 RepID=UPI0012A598C2|nr:ClpP/crotonase-like domain-containing protein [Aspergillus alliaceus]KAB8238951.1 ClpP/crotonase-like domain-containing protein [Aspergillus alliaceus]
MASKYDVALVQLQGPRNGVLLLKLNRPESGNSLHPKLVADMLRAIRWAEQNKKVKVIVLTGNGQFFCTGMELISNDEMSFAIGSDFHQLNEALILSEKILVAAVNGPAVGYGVSSLALLDLVYSIPDAYFFTPFVKWGMAPEAASSLTFARIMGHQRASLLCLTGERILAPEAMQLGLVSKVLPAKDFMGQVMEIAENLAQSPAGSLQGTKRLMKQSVIKELLEANDRECRLIHEERIPSGDPQKGKKQFELAQHQKRKFKQLAKGLL